MLYTTIGTSDYIVYEHDRRLRSIRYISCPDHAMYILNARKVDIYIIYTYILINNVIEYDAYNNDKEYE